MDGAHRIGERQISEIRTGDLTPQNRIQDVRDNVPRPGVGKRRSGMKHRQFTPEKIIGLLRQAEVELAQGRRVRRS